MMIRLAFARATSAVLVVSLRAIRCDNHNVG